MQTRFGRRKASREQHTCPGEAFAVARAVSRTLLRVASECFSVSMAASLAVSSCSCSSTRFAFSFAWQCKHTWLHLTPKKHTCLLSH